MVINFDLRISVHTYTDIALSRLQEEREVLMYCDFHGHSRKKNVFLYGCENKNDKSKQPYSRVFPMMLSKNAKDLVRSLVYQ